MEINNNTFIDVAPIIKNNRDIVRNLILEYRKNESNKFVLFDKEFKFENDGVTYYKVSIGAASNRLLYHYYYYENGRKINTMIGILKRNLIIKLKINSCSISTRN